MKIPKIRKGQTWKDIRGDVYEVASVNGHWIGLREVGNPEHILSLRNTKLTHAGMGWKLQEEAASSSPAT